MGVGDVQISGAPLLQW